MSRGVIVMGIAAAVALAGCNDHPPPPRTTGAPGTVGVVVLVSGHPWFYGTDDYLVPHDCKDPAEMASGQPCRIVKTSVGVARPLRPVLTDHLSRVGAPGSRGALVLYDVGARALFDGDLAALTGDHLPPQIDQRDHDGRDFGAGLRLAAETVGRMPTRRKVLLLVVPELAPDSSIPVDLATTAALLAATQVEVAVVVVDAAISDVDAPRWRAALAGLGGPVVRALGEVGLPVALRPLIEQLAAGRPLSAPVP